MRALFGLALFLAACDRGPPVPSSAENRDLDEAANLLDEAENNLSATEPADPAPAP